MSRTLIKGTEAACGTNAAGASTFGNAMFDEIEDEIEVDTEPQEEE